MNTRSLTKTITLAASVLSVIILLLTIAGAVFIPDNLYLIQLEVLPPILFAAAAGAVFVAVKKKTPSSIAFAFALIAVFIGTVYELLHYLVRGIFTYWLVDSANISYLGLFLFLGAYCGCIYFENVPKDKRRMHLAFPVLGCLVLIASAVFLAVSGLCPAVNMIILVLFLLPSLWFALRLFAEKTLRRTYLYFLILYFAQCVLALIWQTGLGESIGIGVYILESLSICIYLFYIPAALIISRSECEC
ncbi:MAG TPA: hypothetical protein O0X39_06745 [Methanocorpusculum sp.]|nr:hypothetical protein [Methanocorpusculum sp.]